MSLHINRVPAMHGIEWVRTSIALFFRRPLGFSLLFLVFLVAAMILSALPIAGPLLLLASMPLLTLGYAAATRATIAGEAVHAGQLFEPFARGSDKARRNALLRLCALYAALTALVMLLAHAVDGGAFERMQVLMAKARTDETTRQLEALARDPAWLHGMLVRVGLLGLLALPFWHAPMLVWWHGQGLAQSLFSSALACWRNKGAFATYLLGWMGLSAVLGLLASSLVLLLGGGNVVGLFLGPVALMLSVAFYVSLYPVYADSFTTGANAR